MFRRLLSIPVCVMAAAGIGYGICRLAGRQAYPQAALAAAIICGLSGTVTALPVLLSQKANVAAASQAGLVGTLGHFLLTLLLAAAAWALKLVHQPRPFLLWLMIFYWVSLVALVCVVVQVIRQARPPAK